MPSSIMVSEPVLACATGQPCPSCDAYDWCQGAETYLERRDREIALEIKVADKFATGRARVVPLDKLTPEERREWDEIRDADLMADARRDRIAEGMEEE